MARHLMDRVGDKWTILIVRLLGQGTLRFRELQRKMDDSILKKSLALVLRDLERDGLVTRTVYVGTPLRVEYALTPLGVSLLELIGTMRGWAEANAPQIRRAQTDYDTKLGHSEDREAIAP